MMGIDFGVVQNALARMTAQMFDFRRRCDTCRNADVECLDCERNREEFVNAVIDLLNALPGLTDMQRLSLALSTVPGNEEYAIDIAVQYDFDHADEFLNNTGGDNA